ncbi:MAG TPA: methylated-DNA--[protein]-cysteine S-methyltransferase [Acidimicrobiales bacterium]|jgi:methylated-DNA-[protein]-cysteine S-methyltransferase|nr:methylated-DNA--[protein]-cysteine S-methyltransferase [Acidimicrobiales bacterium]HJM27749.1 methylated-DNA--[protein]-cysteine S-methyltransferase [Acidimicrobiales bacterium]HJM97870.1 methylated-DNA--[protein]-cysteine S-methyltransferase [Acidimicrobiales bacterium]
MFHVALFDSPFGPLEVGASSRGISWVLLPGKKRDHIEETPQVDEQHPILNQADKELKEYYKGDRKSFSVPIDLKGTQFQMDVWMSLTTIAYGETETYGGLARSIGRPKAARAVGAANAANPIPIILPCHRVIGANGSLTGYGGGTSLLYIKQELLSLEKKASS